MNYTHFIIKCLVSGIIVGLVSEISRRSTTVAALVASLPLTSLLAFIWIYHESKDVQSIATLSVNIAMIVLPSILFFVLLWLLLRNSFSFYPALGISIVGLAVSYSIYVWLLGKAGIELS